MRAKPAPKPGEGEIETAIARIREKLEYEYGRKIDEAEQKLAEAQKVAEHSGFFASGSGFPAVRGQVRPRQPRPNGWALDSKRGRAQQFEGQ